MTKRISFFIVVILLGIGTIVYIFRKPTVLEKVHYHAGVVVFWNNQKIDFSDLKYMTISPCVEKGGEQPKEDKQNEKAHFHDGIGDVVHVETSGAIWKDLFTNIKYPVDYSKATGYMNGQKVVDFSNIPIRSDDSLVIFMGDNDPKFSTMGATVVYIEEQAKKSTECGEE